MRIPQSISVKSEYLNILIEIKKTPGLLSKLFEDKLNEWADLNPTENRINNKLKEIKEQEKLILKNKEKLKNQIKEVKKSNKNEEKLYKEKKENLKLEELAWLVDCNKSIEKNPLTLMPRLTAYKNIFGFEISLIEFKDLIKIAVEEYGKKSLEEKSKIMELFKIFTTN